MDIENYLSVFLEESHRHMQNIYEGFMVLRKDPSNKDIIDEIFRSAHTIKGISSIMGFQEISDYAHFMENIFQKIKTGDMQINTGNINWLLKKIDKLNSMIDNIAELEPLENQNKLSKTEFNKIFALFSGICQRLAHELGKEVELVIDTRNTMIDCSICSKIIDVFIQLLRNSIDHGIEKPSVRLASGKDRCGKVVLSAYYENEYLVLKVEDDGRGIKPDFVKRRAVELGIIPPEYQKKMNDEEICQLIMRPGFTTVQKATGVSGRGVGLDIVNNVLKDLKGNIKISSNPGYGTTFIIQIPLENVHNI